MRVLLGSSHRELTHDIALVPKSRDHWTRICSALKQSGFPTLFNVYTLQLPQINFQTLETIQRYSSSMPTISREELDAVIVTILNLRPRSAKL